MRCTTQGKILVTYDSRVVNCNRRDFIRFSIGIVHFKKDSKCFATFCAENPLGKVHRWAEINSFKEKDVYVGAKGKQTKN